MTLYELWPVFELETSQGGAHLLCSLSAQIQLPAQMCVPVINRNYSTRFPCVHF